MKLKGEAYFGAKKKVEINRVCLFFFTKNTPFLWAFWRLSNKVWLIKKYKHILVCKVEFWHLNPHLDTTPCWVILRLLPSELCCLPWLGSFYAQGLLCDLQLWGGCFEVSAVSVLVLESAWCPCGCKFRRLWVGTCVFVPWCTGLLHGRDPGAQDADARGLLRCAHRFNSSFLCYTN